MKLAVIFGGKSTEHAVSVVSGTSVLANLNKEKYDIYPIYIGENGMFYKYTKPVNDIRILKFDEKITELEPINNIIEYLNDVDVIFPVLHGLYGEDGTMQGLFELLGKPYVGCKVLGSSLCMDKVYAKHIFNVAGIENAKSMYLRKNGEKYVYIDNCFNKTVMDKNEIVKKVDSYLKLPVFIKPSNQGSSVGVNKAKTSEELIKYLEEAFNYDTKVLLEEEIKGRELECAVLGNEDLIVSKVGEVLSAEDFYTFDSKYKNSKSMTVIPADLDENIANNIQKYAKKAYTACDCAGLSRVDFFVEKDTNRILINEINTLPGFTEISMYPKLIEELGITYSELLDKLIDLAMN